MKKFSSKFLETIALTIAFALFTAGAIAQTVVTGLVTESKKGTALAGITVTVKGTRTSTQTGSDGTFKITVPAKATVLTFSSVGYAVQEAVISGAVVNISLVESSQQLSDVVVVAYGTRKKTDLTGAVTQISAKDFQKGNNNSAEQLLQGKVAGLQITSGGGSAGGGSKLRIRGGASLNSTNDPLIVIDGVPVETNNVKVGSNLLNTINPNDIESMSVLKDASATALYGSRASNGVIIIVSKKGAKGKLKISVGSQVNVGQVTKLVDVLTGDEIRKIVTDQAEKTGTDSWKNILGTANTNWQKEIFQDAVGVDNSISVSGAIGGVLPFRVSGGYLTQKGILKTDKFDRFTGSLNLSPKLFDDHLSINLNLKLSQTKNHFANSDAVGAAASFDPTQSINSVNKYGGYFEWLQANGAPINTNGGSVQPNPLSMLYFRNNDAVSNRFIGNLQLDYKLHFFPDLHVLVNVGRDNIFGKGDDKQDTNLVTTIYPAYKGKYDHYAEIKENTLVEASLFYTKEIKSLKTKLDVLAGHTYQDFTTLAYSYPSYASGGYLIPNTTPTFPFDKPQYRMEGYIGRANLTINNKYLITGSFRRDASSKLTKSIRTGYFPGVAVAWKLKEEFFKNSSKINELKLRFGWGKTGNQDGIGNYSSIPAYNLSTNEGAQYQFGNSYYSYARPGAYVPTITWEKTTTTNIAIDFGFFNNRITGSVDFYKKDTKDLLFTVPVPNGANFDVQVTDNVGSLTNKGVELLLNFIPVKTKDFTWEFGFNIAYNNVKLTQLYGDDRADFSGQPSSSVNDTRVGRQYIGYSPYQFYVAKQVYDPQTGKPIEGLYEDLNRDGRIDDKDLYFYKKPAPDMIFGINTQVTYKKFSLGLAAHGVIGSYAYNTYDATNGLLRNIQDPLQFVHNVSRNYLSSGFTNTQYKSDYYIQNSSFFRLDNINLGYNAGRILNGKANLRIAAAVQNVFVITKFTGMDPENSSDEGLNGTIYPRPRVYTLGFNLDF